MYLLIKTPVFNILISSCQEFYLIKGVLYFLNKKSLRYICFYKDLGKIKKLPIFPHSLLHYKVDIFSFLSLSLISDYSDSERFLIISIYFTIRWIFFLKLSLRCTCFYWNWEIFEKPEDTITLLFSLSPINTT